MDCLDQSWLLLRRMLATLASGKTNKKSPAMGFGEKFSVGWIFFGKTKSAG